MAAVEEAGDSEPAQPFERLLVLHLRHGRAERASLPAWGVQAIGQALADGGAAARLDDERVPFGIALQVRQDIPDDLGGGVDRDLGAEFVVMVGSPLLTHYVLR